jgi:hypothetical protein
LLFNPSSAIEAASLIEKETVVSYKVQTRPGLRLIAYPPAWKPFGLEAASESTTGCGYEGIFTFYELGFPTADNEFLPAIKSCRYLHPLQQTTDNPQRTTHNEHCLYI